MARRFPPPWTVKQSAEAFWVEDAAGKQFGFTYFKARADQPDSAARLSYDEARRIVVNIARLPELLGTTSSPTDS